MVTIVFDWGNTLMKVFPEFQGPMVNWPKVEAMKGVLYALDKLYKNSRLYLATNAKESNAIQVRAALARVGLEQYFVDVFTQNEIGFDKSDPDFFDEIRCKVGPTDIPLMVGDDYFGDIITSNHAGWNGAWYSLFSKPCPALTPFHKIEFTAMEKLPDFLDNLELPSISQSLGWLIGQNANNNLLLHSQAVASVSYLLAVWLRNRGNPIDPVLAHRGGLLHDIAKLKDNDTDDMGIDHALKGSQVLLNAHQQRLAEIASSHLISCLKDEERSPKTWEQKIVNYADKLVEGQMIVTLEERIQAICKRYLHHAERILDSVSGIKRLQSEICDSLNLSAFDLNENISNAFKGKDELTP